MFKIYSKSTCKWFFVYRGRKEVHESKIVDNILLFISLLFASLLIKWIHISGYHTNAHTQTHHVSNIFPCSEAMQFDFMASGIWVEIRNSTSNP